MYRGDGETEIKSGGHVIQIGRDNAGDRSITSGDVVRRVGDGLGCHGYDSVNNRDLPSESSEAALNYLTLSNSKEG